jgi:hypothetical protein
MATSTSISTTLSTHGIILTKQLSYISNISANESRSALDQYLQSNSKNQPDQGKSNLYPIYIVSGFRYVHNQLSYVYLITRPSVLESTKRKFQTVVGIQIYGLCQMSTEPTAQQLQQLLLISESLTTQFEYEMLTQQPILDSNPLRTNAYSPIKLNTEIKRATTNTTAYSTANKSLGSDLMRATSLFDQETTTTPKPTVKNQSIVLTTNKITSAFGIKSGSASSSTPANTSSASKWEDDIDHDQKSPNATKRAAPTGQSAALFGDFDDDLVKTSKTSVKNTFKKETSSTKPVPTAKSTPTTTTTTSATTTTKPSPFSASISDPSRTKPTHSLFDEFDDEDDNMYISSKKNPTQSKSTKATKTTTKPVQAKKAQIVLDSEDDEDNEDSDFDGGFRTLDADDGDLFDDDGSGDDKNRENTKTSQNPSKKSFMGDSDSDDDMVKFAKGNAAPNPSSSVKNTKSSSTSATEKKTASGKVLIESDDDMNDDDDDSEQFSKQMQKANVGKGKKDTSYVELSKVELEEIEENENWDNKKMKIDKNGQKVPLEGNSVKDFVKSGTRINENVCQSVVQLTKFGKSRVGLR